jgi:iron-sulfur cluster repair protein YtfE (RIC family)
MSTTTTQLRLPGQAAAPEGPVDMTMMYLMHHAFRRDLARFAEAVPHTPVDDADAWRALNARWATFSTALHHHHHGEDTWLWPALMERVGAEDRQTLAAMEAEHGDIDPLLDACRDGLARMDAQPSADVRAGLAVRLTAAREHLARHLAHEESDTIALLQRVMTNEEWLAIDEHFKEGVSFGQVLRLVPWVLHEVPAEVRERLFAEPGGSVHRLVWLLTRARFDRQHRTAFRHAPA